MTASLSVIIVTFNSAQDIGTLLSSLHEHSGAAASEIIIVDNASSDDTRALIAQQYPSAQVIARSSNAGLSAAVNEGVAASSGRCVAVLNPDIRFAHDALTPLVDYLAEHPEAGVVAPKLLDEDGALQLSCRAFPGYSTALFGRYSLLSRIFPSNASTARYLMLNFDHTHTAGVDWVSGAAMVIRRDVFDAVGGWDPGLFLFSEDVDFCRRVHEAGYGVVYHPAAVLYHRIGISKHASSRVIIERHKSMWRYYRKHLAGWWPRDVATAAGISARCGWMLAAHGASGLHRQRFAGGVSRGRSVTQA